MRRVVCDTGPILHLLEAGALNVLRLTGAVLIPPVVELELANRVPDWRTTRPAWIEAKTLEHSLAAEAIAWEASGVLHAGEAQSLALAKQIGADWFLTDDAAARILALSIGLEAHGSLGVVLWAAATGHLARPEAELCLDGLAKSSLWVSERVLAEAKSALGELY